MKQQERIANLMARNSKLEAKAGETEELSSKSNERQRILMNEMREEADRLVKEKKDQHGKLLAAFQSRATRSARGEPQKDLELQRCADLIKKIVERHEQDERHETAFHSTRKSATDHLANTQPWRADAFLRH